MGIRWYPRCIPKCKLCEKYLNSLKERNILEDDLKRYKDRFEKLSQLMHEGQVIAVQQTEFSVEVIGFRGASLGDMYYMQLALGNEDLWLRGKMLLSDEGNGTVMLEDWHVFEENKGYGTYFLSTVIAYLKQRGYRKLIGEISPADSDHEDKLRHIYEKTGFEIIDCGDHHSICCWLQDDTTEAAKRKDVAEWLQILEGLSHSDLAEQLGLSKQQFEHVSVHPLFQQDLLHVATEIAQKYRWVGEYML